MRVLIVLAILASFCLWSAEAGHRKLLVDSEGASLTGIMAYLSYVDQKCGDPARTSSSCKNLANQFCGNKDTSEVLCRGGDNPYAQFRSADRYTRVGYLRCSLTKAICYVDEEGYDDDIEAAVDPRSLAAWYEYNALCSNANFDASKVSASTCANLAGKQCDRADVKCGSGYTDFYDVLNPRSRRAIFRGDEKKGLLFFVPQEQPVRTTTTYSGPYTTTTGPYTTNTVRGGPVVTNNNPGPRSTTTNTNAGRPTTLGGLVGSAVDALTG